VGQFDTEITCSTYENDSTNHLSVTSPYASDGGSQFETAVIAYYLAALLCELRARGLLGNVVATVRAQRGELGAPLDDIVLAGVTDDNVITVLHLQIKNKILFTASAASNLCYARTALLCMLDETNRGSASFAMAW